MGVDISAGDLLTMRKLKNTDATSHLYGSIYVAKFNLKCNMQNGNVFLYLNLHFYMCNI